MRFLLHLVAIQAARLAISQIDFEMNDEER